MCRSCSRTAAAPVVCSGGSGNIRIKVHLYLDQPLYELFAGDSLMIAIRVILLISALVTFAGAQGSSTGNSLSGTAWQLVKFQGPDERTFAPDDKSKYTISFGTDGRVRIRVDCNR